MSPNPREQKRKTTETRKRRKKEPLRGRENIVVEINTQTLIERIPRKK